MRADASEDNERRSLSPPNEGGDRPEIVAVGRDLSTSVRERDAP